MEFPFFKINEKENSENYAFYKPSDKVSINEDLKVNNAEYFQITKLKIKSTEDDLYTISADVDNNSDETFENIILRITFYDTNKKTITALDYKLDSIEANSSVSTFATIRRDLSTCEYYSVALKK